MARRKKTDEDTGNLDMQEQIEDTETLNDEAIGSEEDQVGETIEEDGESPPTETESEEKQEQEQAKFELQQSSDVDDESPDDGDEEMVEIVHHGEVKKVTKKKLVELAQQGFDYSQKVGPHQQLAMMVENHPEFARMVNQAWHQYASGTQKPMGAQKGDETEKGKATATVKPLSEYENVDDWVKDTYVPLQEKVVQLEQRLSEASSRQQRPNPNAGIAHYVNMITTHDPVYAQRVLPRMAEYEKNLTVNQYQAIVNDTTGANLLQFYNWVKEQELSKNKKTPLGDRGPAKKKPNPQLKVRSGGGEAPREDDEGKEVWKLSRKDFQSIMDKAKYG